MKKRLLMLPLLLLAMSGLSSCSVKDVVNLTYGSYIQDDLTELETFGDLQAKMSGTEKGENFLLATYQKGGVCSCWDNFQTVLKRYIYEDHVVIYKISNTLFNSTNEATLSSWGITRIKTTSPSLVVVKDGHVKKEFIEDNSTFFYKFNDFKSKISDYVVLPNIYYVDQDILDDAIENNQKLLVSYMWSFCPDCQYCAPAVFYPFSNSHQFTNKMYMIDIGELTGYDPTSETPFANFSTSNETYVKFLKDHKLSADGDATFGYDRGFVPTTQYWENGVLKDMDVYFNDSLSLVSGTWKVTQSYFSETRQSSLHYLNNVSVKVLEGLIIDAEDLTVSSSDSTKASWNKDAASVLHNPLLEAFLTTYAL